MTKEQKNEVRNYFLAKKLPIDLMMEVEDHFVSQINELQFDKNLSFAAQIGRRRHHHFRSEKNQRTRPQVLSFNGKRKKTTSCARR